MKQVHVWPNHVRVPGLDLVLLRPSGIPLERILGSLAALGIDTDPSNVEIHAAEMDA